MKYLVISLDRRPDRKRAVLQQFMEHGFSADVVTFVSAVDGQTLELTDEIAALFHGNTFDSNAAVMGCALSHMRVIQNFMASEDTSVVILEDDIRFTHWVQPGIFEKIAEMLDTKADMVMLGYHVEGAYNIDRPGTLSAGRLNAERYLGGTFGYILYRSGAEKILRTLSQGIPEAIDAMYKRMISSNTLDVFEIGPRIVLSDFIDNYVSSTVDSDIQRSTRVLPCERRRQRTTTTTGKVYIFYHIYCNGSTERIVRDQIAKIIFSGLYDRVDKIHVFLTGSREHVDIIQTYILSSGNKWNIADVGIDDTTYERFTLLKIKHYIRPEDKFLYIHSKGVTKAHAWEHPNIWDWRVLMEYFLMYKHELCIESLEDHDTAGVGYFASIHHFAGTPCYSGNFWWSTGKYFLTLPHDIPDDYLAPEFYIGVNRPNMKILHTSGLEGGGHYVTPYSFERFVDLDA